MKRLFLSLTALGLSFAASAAVADTLSPIRVERNSAGDCTPPSDARACAALHAQIRARFSPYEIGLLFGAKTSRPNYSASYDRVAARYRTFLREADEAVAAR